MRDIAAYLFEEPCFSGDSDIKSTIILAFSGSIISTVLGFGGLLWAALTGQSEIGIPATILSGSGVLGLLYLLSRVWALDRQRDRVHELNLLKLQLGETPKLLEEAARLLVEARSRYPDIYVPYRIASLVSDGETPTPPPRPHRSQGS